MLCLNTAIDLIHCVPSSQYEFERRKFAQELITFDKWFAAGFSAEARTEILTDSADEAKTEHWE